MMAVQLGFGKTFVNSLQNSQNLRFQKDQEAFDQKQVLREQANKNNERIFTVVESLFTSADEAQRQSPQFQQTVKSMLGNVAQSQDGVIGGNAMIAAQLQKFQQIPFPQTADEISAQEAKSAGDKKFAQETAKQDATGAKNVIVVTGGTDKAKQLGLSDLPAGQTFELETLTRGGKTVVTNVTSLAKPAGVTVNNLRESSFSRSLGKAITVARTKFIDDASFAAQSAPRLRQMSDLMKQGLQTGSLQPLVAGLQGIAEDLGIKIDAIAANVGIDINKLANIQEFNKLATRLVIDGFEKFKGNLNQKEVELALDAFESIGDSEEANIRGIAAGLAASEIARDFGIRASQTTTEEEVQKLQAERLSLDSSRFIQLKEKFAKEIRDARGADPTQADPAQEDKPKETFIKTEGGFDYFRTLEGKNIKRKAQ